MTIKRRVFPVLLCCWLAPSMLMAASLDAKVEWADRVILSVPVSGIVSLVAVETGQPIKTGQVLLKLDQAPFLTGLQAAKAAQIQAEADRREARRDFSQTRELYRRGLISNVELENAQLKARRANAAWDAARARVSTANYKLKHSQIIAPFNGWVLSRKVEAGQSIVNTQHATEMLVVAASNTYLARADVSGGKLKKLKPGTSVVVEVDGKKFNGTVRQLGLEPARTTAGGEAYYEVAVLFDSGGHLLRAGQTAEINF